MTSRSLFLVAFWIVGFGATQADDNWSDNWRATIDAAQADQGKPILVKFEASWCGPCRLLTEALKNPESVHLLSRMHTVRIDVDNPPEGAPVEGVTSLPTMRVMTASGDVLGEHVGFIEGEALMDWLRDGEEQFKAKRAAMRLVKQLGDGQLNDEQTLVLIEMLADRSPRQRAAAAGLLIAHPQQVAASVIDAFEKPKLRTRLAALDVLRRWTAPVEGLDPWQPDSITQARIEQLRTWENSFADQGDLHARLHKESEDEAELELDRLVRRGDVRDGAVDSLGLLGDGFRPSVDRRLKTETADTARERLSSVLYRLVAAPTLAIRLPNATDRLASMDADPRREAAQTLSEQAKKEDVPLLETLFGHSDPLVREMALRGLQNAGGGDTTRLTKLLEDPDKNVRAAVLKLWLDSPDPSLVEPVSKQAVVEQDSGLLVYYVRLLKELNSNSKESFAALEKLARSEDWQVRAEVAEAISHRVTTANESVPGRSGVLPSELREAARGLLDDSDSFVLSKIVPAMLEGDQRESFRKLLNVAWKHEEIRAEILPKLTDTDGKNGAVEFLIARLESDQPQDRVFAIDAISRFRLDDQPMSIQQGIEDSDETVQLAAARSLIAWLDQYHAKLKQLPPVPPEDDPFGGLSFGSADFEFSTEIDGAMAEQWVPAQPPTTPGGLLRALGTLFGGGKRAPAAQPPAQLEEADTDAIAAYEAAISAAAYEAAISATEEQDEEQDEEQAEEQADSANAAELQNEIDTFGEIDSFGAEAPAQGDATTPAIAAQTEAAESYDQWLGLWRQSPESTFPWLGGMGERLERLSKKGGETETYARFALLRLGGTATADEVIELAGRVTKAANQLSLLYPWLAPEARRELFEAAGDADDASEILPVLLQQARRYDPQNAGQTYWQSLQRVKTAAFQESWDLRRKLMLVTVGSEYLSFSEPERLEPLAHRLAEQIKSSTQPAARLLGLSVLGELSPPKVAELIADDYNDEAIDETLRRDWARMAIASREEEEATQLALQLMDDDVLLPVSLAFITEGYDGISSTETGEVEVSGVGSNSYSSGRLTIPKITPSIAADQLRPLLDHPDESVVARTTYALAVMGEGIDMQILVRAARSEGLDPYLGGFTNLVVLAIAGRDQDDAVPVLEEIYELMDPDNHYYIKELYWKIRIMTGPKALALRKRIRDEVGMQQLTSSGAVWMDCLVIDDAPHWSTGTASCV